MIRYDWEGMLAVGRSTPGILFLPPQLSGAPLRLATVIRQRRVRALRQPDGRLEVVVRNRNPETGIGDVWIRWTPRGTVETAPTVGENGEP